jgi:cysteine desulfurase / selenocysteine lyase
VLDLAARWRPQFPVTRNSIYLNHAAVAPLSIRSAQAMKDLADDCLEFGALHYDAWMRTYQGFREAAAWLVHADAGEIAIVKNTSEGISTVVLGIDWKPGDRIVCFTEEFPANFLPWKRLEQERGVAITWLSILDPLERIDQACRGARLLAISFVNYLTGYRVDLEAIGEICRRHGAFFFVDAIQGLGVFPIDVRKANIQALAADGHKWLCGPEGCGILYIQQQWQDAVFPVEFGWTNTANHADYSSRDLALRPDAGRYECGTLNTIGCYGLHAAMELVLEVGVENAGRSVLHLSRLLADGAADKGYELAVPWTEESASGIVTVRKAGIDARKIVYDLKQAGVQAAPRLGWVRMAPHFYITPDEIRRTLDLLP